MRVNIYTEELLDFEAQSPIAAEIVTADYVSSRTGQPMTNHGLRIYLSSSPKLHYIPGRDDDRSAVTFWCGPNREDVFAFLHKIGKYINPTTTV